MSCELNCRLDPNQLNIKFGSENEIGLPMGAVELLSVCRSVIVVKAILRSSRVIYCDNQCVKSVPAPRDHPLLVVILHQQYYPNAVFNALSRVTLAAAAAVPGVNDDLHHFTAHEP